VYGGGYGLIKKSDFSYDFEVLTDQTTYLGQYEWSLLNGVGQESRALKGWYLSVTDMSERDIAFIKAKTPNLPPHHLQLGDVSADPAWVR
jgi:hypothetical protein